MSNDVFFFLLSFDNHCISQLHYRAPGDNNTITFTTEANITPMEKFAVPDCHGEGCKGTLVQVAWFHPGGGGGVLRCCLDGGARLKPPNPYPSLRVILAEKGTHYQGFGGKGYPLLGIFSQENYVFVYFSDEMGEISSIYSKITKVGGMFRDFPAPKTGTHVQGLLAEKSPIRAAHPRLPYYVSTPPPPRGST